MVSPAPLSWLYRDVHCLGKYICKITSKGSKISAENYQSFVGPNDDAGFLKFVRDVYVVPSNIVPEIQPNYLKKMSTEAVRIQFTRFDFCCLVNALKALSSKHRL